MSDKPDCSACREWMPHIDYATPDDVERAVKSGKLTKSPDTCSKWLCNCGECPIDTPNKLMSDKTWLQKMDDLLAEEKADGMVGFKMFATRSSPTNKELSPDEAEKAEKIAELYCKLEYLKKAGKLKTHKWL